MKPFGSALAPLLGLFVIASVASACAWRAQPSESPGGPLVYPDLAFAERTEGPLLADVFRPTRAGPHPGLLIVHPGGWRSGSRGQVAQLARRAAEAGYVVITPDHRHAPVHRFPAQLDDVAEAVRWLRSNAGRFDLDPERVGAFGYSSGAHLVALLGTRPPAGARLQAVAGGAMISDLDRLSASFVVRGFLGTTRPEAIRAASPLEFVSDDDPPFLLAHGRLDWIAGASHSRRMFEALRRSGVPSELHLGWRGHFTTFLTAHGFDEALAFFDRWLRVPEALARTRSRAEGAEILGLEAAATRRSGRG